MQGRNVAWLFSSSGDTFWKWDSTAATWSKLENQTGYPSNRTQGSTFTFNNDFFLFGGWNMYSTPTLNNDLWKYNIGSQPGNPTWQYVNSAGMTPTPRRSPESWTDSNGDLWIFGGGFDTTGDSFGNDLWQYTIATEPASPHWRNHTPDSYAPDQWPQPTIGSGSKTDANGNLYMFGGQLSGSSVFTNDTWRFDIVSGSLEFTTPPNTPVTITPSLKDPSGVANLSIVTQPTNGSVAPILTGGRTTAFTYTPNSNWTGTDNLVLGLTNAGATNKTKPVTILVNSSANSTINEWGLYD